MPDTEAQALEGLQRLRWLYEQCVFLEEARSFDMERPANCR